MTASMWLPLGLLALPALVVQGKVWNAPDSNGPANFYEHFSSKVDRIEAAADIDAQEQKQIPRPQPQASASASKGADVLEKWAATHDGPQPVVDMSVLGKELGEYALKLRDGTRLKAVQKAKAEMLKATAAKESAALSKQQESAGAEISSAQGDALAKSGSNLLKRWSSSHATPAAAAAVKPKTAPAKPPVVSDAARPSSAKVAPKIQKQAAESPKAKAFARAHATMRGLDSAPIPNLETATAPAQQMPQGLEHLAASGGDLLANWAKKRSEASQRKDFESDKAKAKLPRSAVTSGSHASSVHDDLQSLRATMHDMLSRREAQKVMPAHKIKKVDPSNPELAVENDRANLKKAMKEIMSKSMHAHEAMHSFQDDDVDANAPTSSTIVSPGASVGSDELAKWSQNQKRKSFQWMSPEAAPSQKEVPSVGVDAMHSHTEATAFKDSLSAEADRLKKWQSSSLHNAMHNIASSADNLDSDAEQNLDVTAQKAGANALEQWSKAHQPKQVPMFMKRQALLSPSAAHSSSVGTSVPDVKSNDVERMQMKEDRWHMSSVHEAMRNLGDDGIEQLNDAIDGTVESDSVSAKTGLQGEQAAGINALDQWSKAHEKPKYVFRMPELPLTSRNHVASVAAPATPQNDDRAQNHVTNDVENLRASAQKLHESAIHEAMRNIGSDAADLDVKADSNLAPTDTGVKDAQAAGSNALDRWSQAHEKSSKFMFRMPDMTLPSQSQSATVAAPAAPQHEDDTQSHMSNDMESLQASARKLHESAIHEAMHSIGNDVTVGEQEDLNAQPSVESLKAAGADALSRWSKAHETPTFVMPHFKAESAPVAAPVMPADEVHVRRHSAEDLKISAKRLRQSAVHNAMHKIGSGVPDIDLNNMQHESAEKLTAVGADALERWSKSHEKKEKAFTMPAADGNQVSPVPTASQADAAFAQPLHEPVVDMRTDLKKLHESAVHEAMHETMRNIGNGAPKVNTESLHSLTANPVYVPPVATDGQGLMDSWSKVHSQKPRQHFLVDMYPATPAPEQDMLAMALSRGFGKKVEVELEAQVSKANHLHESMQSMAGNTDSLADATTRKKEASSQASASAGADILSRWSKTHSTH